MPATGATSSAQRSPACSPPDIRLLSAPANRHAEPVTARATSSHPESPTDPSRSVNFLPVCTAMVHTGHENAVELPRSLGQPQRGGQRVLVDPRRLADVLQEEARQRGLFPDLNAPRSRESGHAYGRPTFAPEPCPGLTENSARARVHRTLPALRLTLCERQPTSSGRRVDEFPFATLSRTVQTRQRILSVLHTAGGIRTPTPLRAADFESAMSTVPSPRRAMAV